MASIAIPNLDEEVNRRLTIPEPRVDDRMAVQDGPNRLLVMCDSRGRTLPWRCHQGLAEATGLTLREDMAESDPWLNETDFDGCRIDLINSWSEV